MVYYKTCLSKKREKQGPGIITGSYFIGYGLIRFILEYFREPDSQIGFVIKLGKEYEPLALFKSVLNISLGQILCFLMIVAGICVLLYSRKSSPITYTKKKNIKKNSKGNNPQRNK